MDEYAYTYIHIYFYIQIENYSKNDCLDKTVG